MPTEEVDGIEQVDVVKKSLPLSTLIYTVIQEFKKLIDKQCFFYEVLKKLLCNSWQA